MLNKKQVYAVIDNVLSFCNYYTMVSIDSEEEGLTRFANSEIHQNVYTANNTVTIKVYDGKKESKITTNLLDDDSLKEVVREAEENLKFIPEGEIEIPELTDPKEIASEAFDETLDDTFGIIQRSNLIKEGVDLLSKDFTAAGALSLNKMVFAMGNNRGIRRYGRMDTVNFSTAVIHKDGSSGFVHYKTDKANEVDIIGGFNIAYEKAKTGINPLSLEPGAYTVILEPLAVSDLLNYMNYCGFSGRSTQVGSSYLTDKKGQRVFGENITIRDDLHDENTLPLYFDFEGYKRKALTIIDKGVVKELAYDIKSALKEGVETTGHSIGSSSMGGFPINLVMEGDKGSLEDLIKSTSRGILVTRFHYMNVIDPRQAVLTALTRDGSFLIEDGKIKSGIKNLRFTQSMLEAFNHVTGITADRVKAPGFFGVNYVPALRIDNFHFTGKTE